MSGSALTRRVTPQARRIIKSACYREPIERSLLECCRAQSFGEDSIEIAGVQTVFRGRVIDAEIHGIDRNNGVERVRRQLQLIDVTHPKSQAMGFRDSAVLCLTDRALDVIQPGDVRAGPIGYIFRDQPVAATQIESMVTRIQLQHLQQKIKLGLSHEAVLTQVPAEYAFTKEMMCLTVATAA